MPNNPDYEPLDVGLLGQTFEVWGVVTHTVTSMTKSKPNPFVHTHSLQQPLGCELLCSRRGASKELKVASPPRPARIRPPAGPR